MWKRLAKQEHSLPDWPGVLSWQEDVVDSSCGWIVKTSVFCRTAVPWCLIWFFILSRYFYSTSLSICTPQRIIVYFTFLPNTVSAGSTLILYVVPQSSFKLCKSQIRGNQCCNFPIQVFKYSVICPTKTNFLTQTVLFQFPNMVLHPQSKRSSPLL